MDLFFSKCISSSCSLLISPRCLPACLSVCLSVCLSDWQAGGATAQLFVAACPYCFIFFFFFCCLRLPHAAASSDKTLKRIPERQRRSCDELAADRLANTRKKRAVKRIVPRVTPLNSPGPRN